MEVGGGEVGGGDVGETGRWWLVAHLAVVVTCQCQRQSRAHQPPSQP